MVPSLPLLSCELPMSVKENPNRKKNISVFRVKTSSQQVLTHGPIQKMHPIVYDNIDKELIKKVRVRTKEGVVSSGLDADG